MVLENAASYHIQGAQTNAIKTKSFYDLSNRLQYFVVAPKHAKDGDMCQVTKYTYVAASSRVDASVEYVDIWQSAWDITEDVLP
jgi:hypothetical protein